MAATITPLIDGKQETWTDAFNCVRRYYVNGALDEDQYPQEGMPFDVEVSNWPDGYVVTNSSYEAIIEPEGMPNTPNTSAGVLTVNGSRVGATAGHGTSSDVTAKLNTVRKSMKSTKIRITAHDVGAHRATRKDLGFYNSGGVLAEKGTDYKTPVPTGHTDSGYAEEGVYVYNNAQSAKYIDADGNVQDRVGGATSGSARTWTGMIFRDTSGDNPLTLMFIDMQLTCRLYTLTYWLETNATYSTNAPADMDEGLVRNWGPSGGRMYGPVTRSKPSTKRWRCYNQLVEPDRDANGDYLLKVTRMFIRVPSIFDKLGKSVNWNRERYGTWDDDWTADRDWGHGRDLHG